MSAMSESRPVERIDTGALSGFRPIFRKEIDEWFITNRFEIAAILATLFASAGPVIYWIYKGGFGNGGKLEVGDNTYQSIISSPALVLSTLGLFMVIALTMGTITREQDIGTLQWIFTKPVSRAGLVMAKWLANSLMTVVAIIVIPAIVSYGVIDLLFGVRNRSEAILGLSGIVALFIFQCALSCGLAAILNGSAAVAGISFALVFLPGLLTPLIHDWARLLPSAISDVANAMVQGESLDGWDIGTIVSTIVVTILIMVVATNRLTRREYR
jgi:ABC-2 type transport system permease protein